MTDNNDITKGLRSLKLADKGGKKKPSPSVNNFDWGTTDSWIDDDFDASELINNNVQVNGDEDDWADIDDDADDNNKNETITKSRKNKTNENWRKPMQSKNDKLTHNINRRNSNDKGWNRNEIDSRRNKDTHDNSKFIRSHYIDKKVEIPKEPKKLKERHERHYTKPQVEINVEDKKKKDLARLMPIAGWKLEPSEENVIDYETYTNEDVENEETSWNFKGKVNKNSEDLARLMPYNEQNQDIDNNEPLTKHGKHRKHKKNNSREETSDAQTNVVRIHYTDDVASEHAITKSHLESKWANEEVDTKAPPQLTEESALSSREKYRQQKIKSQLDWDNGIQHRPEDNAYNSDDDTSTIQKPITTHTHFSYDNSITSQSKTTKIKHKPAVLESRWA
jgi:hypothetical protein